MAETIVYCPSLLLSGLSLLIEAIKAVKVLTGPGKGMLMVRRTDIMCHLRSTVSQNVTTMLFHHFFFVSEIFHFYFPTVIIQLSTFSRPSLSNTKLTKYFHFPICKGPSINVITKGFTGDTFNSCRTLCIHFKY